MLKQFSSVIIGLLVFIIFILLSSSIYIVDETKQVFVTRFGKIVSDPINTKVEGESEAGLYFRIPFIDQVYSFEKRYLEWDGDSEEVATRSKVMIEINTYARWRINNAMIFYKALRNEDQATTRLDDLLDGAARTVIAAHDLVEVIRSHQREATQPMVDNSGETQTELEPFTKGRSALAQEVIANVKSKLNSELGIELLDFRFKRINYTEQVRQEIFKRMVSERTRVASKFRSEGDGQAAKIKGQQERELKTIQSKAYLQQQQIRGEADAKAVAIYAEAYNQSLEAREFYEFLKTMETYESTLSDQDTLILSTDSDFFRFLKESTPASD